MPGKWTSKAQVMQQKKVLNIIYSQGSGPVLIQGWDGCGNRKERK